MIISPMEILSQINLYSVTGVVLLFLIVLSLISDRIKADVKTYLRLGLIIWVVFFAYEVRTGNNLFKDATGMTQSEKDGARYEGAYINGKFVRWDKVTGEVVKESK